MIGVTVMQMKKSFAMTLVLGMMSFTTFIGSDLVGQKAPLFISQAVFPPRHHESKSKYTVGEFDLKKYIGHHKIVLYFYPMDNTPGCTKEAQKFRDDIEILKEHGIMVIGVSCDSIESHLKFQKKYALPFILVHDSRWYRKISKMYHVAGLFYSKRKTFLIDKKGMIIHVFEQVDIPSQVDDIIRIFKNN